MNASSIIPILKETSVNADSCYHNTLPLLHEIAHALQRLQADGTTTTLDLNAIPFGPGDERRLIDFLGSGEISAKLEAMGESRIWESAYPGVWVIDHRGATGERVAFQIEITKLPGILEAQPEEIVEALSALQKALEDLQAGEPV